MNPDLRIVLMEPFVVPFGRMAEDWEHYGGGMAPLRKIVRDLAGEFDARFVPLQERFDALTTGDEFGYWIWDGVHPTMAGHEVIARAWVETVFGTSS